MAHWRSRVKKVLLIVTAAVALTAGPATPAMARHGTGPTFPPYLFVFMGRINDPFTGLPYLVFVNPSGPRYLFIPAF
jgi:hypothetical protein